MLAFGSLVDHQLTALLVGTAAVNAVVDDRDAAAEAEGHGRKRDEQQQRPRKRHEPSVTGALSSRDESSHG